MTRSPSMKYYSKATRKFPEAQLQEAVVQWLRLAGVPGMLFLSIPNEGKRDERTAGFLKARGMRPGAADLLIVVNGKAHFLEAKAKGEKQEGAQLTFEAECVLASTPYACVDNIDDAIRILRQWKAIDASMAGKWGSVSKRRQQSAADEARRAA